MERQPEVIADRAHALATCPAKAPGPWDHTDARGPLQNAKKIHHLDPAIRAVQTYFDRLTDAQRGQWWLDLPNNRVVVQVTHDPEAVLSELRGRVGDPNTVALELVRYSQAQVGSADHLDGRHRMEQCRLRESEQQNRGPGSRQRR